MKRRIDDGRTRTAAPIVALAKSSDDARCRHKNTLNILVGISSSTISIVIMLQYFSSLDVIVSVVCECCGVLAG